MAPRRGTGRTGGCKRRLRMCTHPSFLASSRTAPPPCSPARNPGEAWPCPAPPTLCRIAPSPPPRCPHAGPARPSSSVAAAAGAIQPRAVHVSGRLHCLACTPAARTRAAHAPTLILLPPPPAARWRLRSHRRTAQQAALLHSGGCQLHGLAHRAARHALRRRGGALQQPGELRPFIQAPVLAQPSP